MELTFVHQYDGDPPKRRRLAKACESCRHRKKRCSHYSRANLDEDGNDQPSIASPRNESSVAIQESTPPPSVNERAHFISDLIPEATLLNGTSPTVDQSPKRQPDNIGIWVSRHEWEALIKQKSDNTNVGNQVSDVRQNTRPHPAVLETLIDLYFEKIHLILPLLDEQEFRRDHAGGVVPETLVYVMVLAVAKHAEAEPHLSLSHSREIVAPRQFCSNLHASITAALRTPVRFEKVTLIRILALTSLHSEGADGAEEASIWLSQAMHYAQTLGIHLGQQATAPVGNDLNMKRLFWCLYALDRANAATNGRPIIMSDADIAIAKFAPGESGFPAFEAWLRVVDLLNQIIDFYRPTHSITKTGWEEEFPGLEEILDDVGGWNLPTSVLKTIHLFYLAVAILSHRTRGIKESPRGLVSNVRQRLCAIEVVRLMSATSTRTPLHALPIVPYAVALSLSVAYQHLRHSQLEHQQADALDDFRTCCRILQLLRRVWSCADVMATLAKKVLEELDRAPDLASFRVRRSKRDHHIDEGPTAADLIPPPTACHHGVGTVHQQQQQQQQPQPLNTANGNGLAASHLSSAMADEALGKAHDGSISLFDNVDDVFGTFLDPNYPLNLDDMTFVDDWPTAAAMPSWQEGEDVLTETNL